MVNGSVLESQPSGHTEPLARRRISKGQAGDRKPDPTSALPLTANPLAQTVADAGKSPVHWC